MNRTRALPGVLEVLDDGLRLYRRNLSGFLLVATTVLVLLAILALSFMAFVRTEIGDTAGWTLLAVFLLIFLSYPLVLYAFAALSRATATTLDGRPINLRTALAISPARGCGMLLFNTLFAIVAGIMAAILFLVLACPMSIMSLMGLGLLSAVASTGTFGAGFAFLGVISQISWLWWVAMFGAWLTSLVYAVQAFVIEQGSWGQTASRAIELVTARFGQSLLMFLGSGAIFGTLTVAYLGSMLVLLATIEERLSLDLPPLAADVVIIVLTVLSLVVLLPPLSIWMAMFYRRLAHERDGDELTQRIATWQSDVARSNV